MSETETIGDPVHEAVVRLADSMIAEHSEDARGAISFLLRTIVEVASRCDGTVEITRACADVLLRTSDTLRVFESTNEKGPS